MPGGSSGDFYAELRIVTPPAQDDDSRRFYRQMAERFAYDPRSAPSA